MNTGQCTEGTLAWLCSNPAVGHCRPVWNHVTCFPFCRDERPQPRGSAHTCRGDHLWSPFRRVSCAPSATCGRRSVPDLVSGMCAEATARGDGASGGGTVGPHLVSTIKSHELFMGTADLRVGGGRGRMA